MPQDAPNISTEYQPKGAALDPSDTLDRPADSRDYLKGGDKGRAADDVRRKPAEDPGFADNGE